MHNTYGIKTIRVKNDLIASYFVHYQFERAFLYCTVGGENISEYIPSVDDTKAIKPLDAINRALSRIEDEDPEIFDKIMNFKKDPLMCPYSFYVWNDDVTSAEFVHSYIMKSALNMDDERAEKAVQQIHDSSYVNGVEVMEFNSYESAHTALVLAMMMNNQTDNNLRMDIRPKVSEYKNYNALFTFLIKEEMI